MRINEIIREKRKEQALTQEQIAEYLGVSTPAVNKWEKGNTCPDITLLPALARLLKIDLNTLFSFNEDLTELEVENFTKEIVSIIQEKGYDEGFQTAMGKIQEYPLCELLIYTVAVALDGALIMFPVENKESYKETLEKLYERIAESENQQIQSQVISMLVSRYVERGDYEKAEELIDSLPTPSVDKTLQQACLYIKQERRPEAAKLLEHKLLSMATEIPVTLVFLMEIALKENRLADAQYHADISEKVVRLFGLMDFSAYTGHFQLAAMQKDADTSIAVVKSMLTAMEKKWDIKNSPLYRHIVTSEEGTFSTNLFLSTMIEALQTDKEFEFLRSNTEFSELLEQYKNI